ncbi:uncharacterized protein RMCB_2910 [Mycolicibacterium brisbanense]|uniref:Transposase n=1 Tax=Mycolicibacterium brisbanense TaxID=146020 RepID=A0A100VZF5_9MYCO|nr:uncharacterized protein RMCB_2910 [Mycolicibacterium brisbanense]
MHNHVVIAGAQQISRLRPRDRWYDVARRATGGSAEVTQARLSAYIEVGQRPQFRRRGRKDCVKTLAECRNVPLQWSL